MDARRHQAFLEGFFKEAAKISRKEERKKGSEDRGFRLAAPLSLIGAGAGIPAGVASYLTGLAKTRRFWRETPRSAMNLPPEAYEIRKAHFMKFRPTDLIRKSLYGAGLGMLGLGGIGLLADIIRKRRKGREAGASKKS